MNLTDSSLNRQVFIEGGTSAGSSLMPIAVSSLGPVYFVKHGGCCCKFPKYLIVERFLFSNQGFIEGGVSPETSSMFMAAPSLPPVGNVLIDPRV